MEEKRKGQRFKDENEVVITVISEGSNIPRETVIQKRSTDISVLGARIQGNIPLTVDTLFRIDVTLEKLHQKITTFGKVKWIKIVIADESFEEGVEFVNTPDEAINKLKDYLSYKLKSETLKPFSISAELNEAKSE
jgi:hypothetical protein